MSGEEHLRQPATQELEALRKTDQEQTERALALNGELLPTLETAAAMLEVNQAVEEQERALAEPEASKPVQRTEISYGPTARQQLEAFAGVPLRSLRNFANNVYVKPTYSAYEYPDGRVLVVLNKIATDMVYILPDAAAFRQFEADHFAYDPEDSRVAYNGRHAGRLDRA